MLTSKDFDSDFENKWCPGCGNFGILTALKEALAAMNLSPPDVLLVSGIGQACKTPHFLKCNFFHGLHGRALPLATGAKIANHDLTILVHCGDGDAYGEGGNHFLAAVRRNIDLTLIVHDNKVYGLTKGQASPTSDREMVTRAQPFGVLAAPFNPLLVALALGAGFVARGFAGRPKHLSGLIRQAVAHRGFSLIDVLQPCVSFNHVNTHKWYNERVYELEGEGYDPENLEDALARGREWGERIPIGLFYRAAQPSFTERLPALKAGPLLDQPYRAERLTRLLAAAGPS